MKNIVISLTTANQRREHITQEFGKHGIDFEFFDAVTIANLANVANQLNLAVLNNTPNLADGEKGCFLSHVSLWQKMIDDDLQVMAIFEDDVHLGKQAELFLTQADWLNREIGLLKIEHFAHEVALGNVTGDIHGRMIQPLLTANLGTAGYIIRQDTAKKLLDLLKNKTEQEIIAIDHFMFKEVINNQEILVHQLNPALCIQSDRLDPTTTLQSDLNDGRRQRMNQEKQHRTPMQKIKRELGRLFGKISQVSQKMQKMEFK